MEFTAVLVAISRLIDCIRAKIADKPPTNSADNVKTADKIVDNNIILDKEDNISRIYSWKCKLDIQTIFTKIILKIVDKNNS